MKVKKAKKTPKKTLLDTKAKKITAGAITAAVLIIIVVIMIIEETQKSQLIIHNNTDLNLEYVKMKYVFPEGDLTGEVQTDKIEANKSLTEEVAEVNLYGLEANCEITFKFENQDEMNIDAGSFSDIFKGKIKINFKKTDDPDIYKMTVKADTGLIPSKLISCDEEFTVDFKEGTVYGY